LDAGTARCVRHFTASCPHRTHHQIARRAQKTRVSPLFNLSRSASRPSGRSRLAGRHSTGRGQRGTASRCVVLDCELKNGRGYFTNVASLRAKRGFWSVHASNRKGRRSSSRPKAYHRPDGPSNDWKDDNMGTIRRGPDHAVPRNRGQPRSSRRRNRRAVLGER